MKSVLSLVFKLSKDTQEPFFVIFDDTIVEKTKPSLQAIRPIEAAGFHHSHLKRKQVYGLCDFWFTNEKVIQAHFKRGYHLIGALKTNRIVYPKGIRIKVKDFTQYIEKSDVCSVTVNSTNYWVY